MQKHTAANECRPSSRRACGDHTRGDIMTRRRYSLRCAPRLGCSRGVGCRCRERNGRNKAHDLTVYPFVLTSRCDSKHDDVRSPFETALSGFLRVKADRVAKPTSTVEPSYPVQPQETP